MTKPELKIMRAKKTIGLACPHCGFVKEQVSGDYLRDIRQDSGMSLRALARETGISVGFLCDIERGRKAAACCVVAEYEARFLRESGGDKSP